MNIETVIEWAHRPLQGAECVLSWVLIPGLMFGAIAAYVSIGILWEDGHKWSHIITRAIFAFFWPITVPIYLATWPARKAWGWWKRRKAEAHWLPEVGKCYSWKHRDSTVYMLIRSVADDVVRYDYCMRDALSPNRYRGAVAQDSAERIADFRRFVNRRPVEVPTELLEKAPDAPKQVAPNTPYGSKPSGEPEWRRAVDELEGRVAALEGEAVEAREPVEPSAIQWTTRPTDMRANGVQQDYGPKAFIHSLYDDRSNDCWELHAGVGKTEFYACGHGKMPPLSDLRAWMERQSA